MEFTETEQALKLFGDYVIQQSRSNLTKDKHNVDGKLYESLKHKPEIYVTRNFFTCFLLVLLRKK